MDKPFSSDFWSQEDFIKFIGENDDRLRVVEDIISLKTQNKAMQLAEKFKAASIPDEKALEMAEQLWNPYTKLKEIHKILVILAFRSNVQAFRIIEKYKENPHPRAEEMVRFCYHISKISLEGELTDQPLGLIATGLGGKKTKLRFLLVIFPENPVPLTKAQQKIIQNEWKEICAKYDIETESKYSCPEYVLFRLLSPLRVDFAEVAREFVTECNLYGNFLSNKILITNVRLLKKWEILSALEQIRSEKKGG
ncbi:MAG: hypothetical protein ACP5O2_03605 [Bacteroidales bacterium]